MSNHDIVYQILEVWTNFISRTPSSGCYFELTVLYHFLKSISVFLSGPRVPHLKHLNLRESKSPIRMLIQFFYDWFKNHSGKTLLQHIVCSGKLVIYRLFEARCFGIWNDMNDCLFGFYCFSFRSQKDAFRVTRINIFLSNIVHHFVFL